MGGDDDAREVVGVRRDAWDCSVSHVAGSSGTVISTRHMVLQAVALDSWRRFYAGRHDWAWICNITEKGGGSPGENGRKIRIHALARLYKGRSNGNHKWSPISVMTVFMSF